MVLGLDMRFLGRKWQKKNCGNSNSNKMSGLTEYSLGAKQRGLTNNGWWGRLCKHQALWLRQRKTLARRQLSSPHIPSQNSNVVRNLIRHQQPPPTRIKRQMTRHLAAAGGSIQQRQSPALRRYRQ